MNAETRDARASSVQRHFEKPLLIAAVLSIPTTILQFTHVAEPWHALGELLNWLIWFAFLAELLTMLAVVPDRSRYLLTHPIDLGIVLLTPPFLVSAVQSVRWLRLLRVFRLLRLEPLARLMFSLEGVRATAGLALLTAIAGGAGFAAEEGISEWREDATSWPSRNIVDLRADAGRLALDQQPGPRTATFSPRLFRCGRLRRPSTCRAAARPPTTLLLHWRGARSPPRRCRGAGLSRRRRWLQTVLSVSTPHPRQARGQCPSHRAPPLLSRH